MKRFALLAALALGAFATALPAQAGSFRSHKNYKVSGSASVNGSTLRLSNFRTSNGPDLYIYVGNGSASKRVAKLKATRGAQTYRLPKGNWTTVHVHCKRFNSTFGTASIR